MLIAGAKRHAKEILELLHQLNEIDELYFFDDISVDLKQTVYKKYPIIKSLDAIREFFGTQPEFILGLGGTRTRNTLAEKLINQGGKLISLFSKDCNIGHYDVDLGPGLNVMYNALISNSVKIGAGTLVNAFVSVHHDVSIGRFCELSPHSVVLGGCTIGDFTSIGSNATILPNIKIGNDVIIGAGSVVTKNIPDNATAFGVPAQVKYIGN